MIPQKRLPRPPKLRVRGPLKSRERCPGKPRKNFKETPLGGETSKHADGSETGGNPENVSGVLTGASTLLKTLKPCTKAVKVKRVMPSDGPTGLLKSPDPGGLILLTLLILLILLNISNY